MFKKIWWPELGPNGPKFGQKLGFLPLSQAWFGSSRGKNRKKNLGPNLSQSSQNHAQNQVFCHFLKFGSL